MNKNSDELRSTFTYRPNGVTGNGFFGGSAPGGGGITPAIMPSIIIGFSTDAGFAALFFGSFSASSFSFSAASLRSSYDRSGSAARYSSAVVISASDGERPKISR